MVGSLVGAFQSGGRTAPALFSSAEIGAATVVVTFTSVPLSTTGNTVKVNGTSVTISTVIISGATLRITLADAPDGIDTLLVSNSGAGNIVAFTDQAVTNNAVSMASFGTLKVALTGRRPDYLYETSGTTDPVEDADLIYTASSPWGGGYGNLIQATSGDRPTWNASTKAAQFVRASADFMDANIGTACAGVYTAVFVFDETTGGIEQDLGGDGFAVGGTTFTTHQSGQGIGFYHNSTGWQVYNGQDVSVGMWLVVYDSRVSGGNQTIKMYLAKVGTDTALTERISATAAYAAPGGSTTMRVGKRNTTGAAFGGDIYEALFYHGGVSNITTFNAHLALRWL